MLHASAAYLAFLTVLDGAIAGPVKARAAPTVTLDNAIVTGITSGSTNQFLGIPFAQPPTGDLRFRLPQQLPPYNASFSAMAKGPACLQQATGFTLPAGLLNETITYLVGSLNSSITSSAEDCLTLDVITPANATTTDKLPVVVWIYGGAFEAGSTQLYNGSVIAETAIALDVPVVYVAMNYRLNAFGFLAGKEIKDAGVGNLGLQDQRLAFQWVQKYISAFGGDPTKVTIWGESAGAISVSLHMLTNGGDNEGLFRAAFMESGSPIPVGDITRGQPTYDALVAATGCSGAMDTLQCLRSVPYETIMSVVNQSPGEILIQALLLEWVPRVDGVFLTADPQQLVLQGSVADVPFVNGDCDDEGTLFSLLDTNVTTDTQFEQFVQTYLLPNASSNVITHLMEYYPSNLTQGSPFDTGYMNALTPQFKRMAALLGDMIFQAPRRLFLQKQSGEQNIWTYLSKRFKNLPDLGSTHASDLINVYGGGDMASYLVRFVANLDPNVGESTDLYWPQYCADANRTMLEFLDGSVTQALTTDTYRANAIAYLTKVMLANPL